MICLLPPLIALDSKPLLSAAEVDIDESHGLDILRSTFRLTHGDGEKRTALLTAHDLESTANYLIARKGLQGTARATIEGQQLKLIASIRLPRWPYWFVNIRLIAADHPPIPAVTHLWIGQLELPDFLVNAIIKRYLKHRGMLKDGEARPGIILSARIRNDRLSVNLAGEPQTRAHLRDLITEAVGIDRALAYHNRLASVLKESNSRQFIRLSHLFQPMFALAAERSHDSEPVLENKAVILLLAAYVNGLDLMGGDADTTEPLIERSVLLQGRQDLSRHFMTSAALALAGHRALADVIGLAKELNDTHGGSGFSFVDLAADRAGTLFGKHMAQPQHARRMMLSLGENADDSLFMPDTRDLPENLRDTDFQAQFRGGRGPEFEKLKRLIDERVERLALYNAH